MTKEKKLPSLKEIKDKYLTDENIEYIEEYYGTEKSVDFARNVAALEDKDYYIVGYGSLMKESDAKRTFKYLKSIRGIWLYGWRRIFNMGRMETGSYLNVYKVSNDSDGMPVALLKVSFRDMPEFFLREILYNADTLELNIDGKLKGAYIVHQPDISRHTIGIQPILTYTLLCIEGIKDFFGYDGMKGFYETTELYNGRPINEWLNTVNILEYAETHKHTTR